VGPRRATCVSLPPSRPEAWSPSEESGNASQPITVTCDRCALVRLLAASEFYKPIRVAACLGSPRSSTSLACRRAVNSTGLDHEAFPEPTLPRSLQPRDNPLLRFRPSSGFHPHHPVLASPRIPPPMGFSPVQRIRQWGSGYPERSQSLGTFRLQGFAPSCRFSPPESRPGLFHPGSAHRVQPFRGFPSQEAAPP